jgi:tyrosine-protein kinase Src
MLQDADAQPGCFLVRNSEHNPNGFSLSVKDFDQTKGNHVKHYKIKPHESGSGYFIAANHLYPTLQALVQAYKGNMSQDKMLW